MSADDTSGHDLPRLGEDRLGAAGDDAYAALMNAHEGLSFEDSAALNARLVLILMNLVGDPDLIRDAVAAAGAAGPRRP